MKEKDRAYLELGLRAELDSVLVGAIQAYLDKNLARLRGEGFLDDQIAETILSKFALAGLSLTQDQIVSYMAQING